MQSDLDHFQDNAHTLTPNVHLHYKLRQAIALPYVNAAPIVSRVLDLLPRAPKHLVVVPMLGTAGGSEKISADLIRLLSRHYAEGDFGVFCPDAISRLGQQSGSIFGAPIGAINDVCPLASSEDRIDIFDRVLIELRPHTVHSVNSDTAWLAFVEYSKFYREHSALFGNAYSDIRIDTLPVGAFWRYVPRLIEDMSGIIVDNGSVLKRAKSNFCFTESQIQKFTVLPTAVDLSAGMRPYERSQSAEGRSLWVSRIAIEKRLDVLAEIVRRIPERNFEIYGSVIEGAAPVDLSWVDDCPNVFVRGRFDSLSDIPIRNFESFIFTTSAEGMPIVLLEMTMLGLPIAAPDVGGIAEFVDSETGWLVSGPDAVAEYISALEEIASNPKEASRRVARAQQRLVARHSWANFVDTVHKIPLYIAGQGL